MLRRAPAAMPGFSAPIGPPPFVSLQAGTNVGAYLRQNIIYLDAHVEELSQAQWSPCHNTLYMKFGRTPSQQHRDYFWKHQAPQMLTENDYLYAIVAEIKWSCEQIHKLHLTNKSWTGYLNLQRRCIYSLYLCIDALIDLRVIPEHDQVTSTPAMSEVMCPSGNPQVEAMLGGASGLLRYQAKDQKWYRRLFTCIVTIHSPLIYPARNSSVDAVRLKLPAHFMKLVTRMLGDQNDGGGGGGGATVGVPLFRALLVRYALFLSRLIWHPASYDLVTSNKQMNPWYVLDTVPEQLGNVMNLHVGIATNVHHQPYLGLGCSDIAQVSQTPWPRVDDHAEKFLELPDDGTAHVCPESVFDGLYNHNRMVDAACNVHSQAPNKYWTHVM